MMSLNWKGNWTLSTGWFFFVISSHSSFKHLVVCFYGSWWLFLLLLLLNKDLVCSFASVFGVVLFKKGPCTLWFDMTTVMKFI